MAVLSCVRETQETASGGKSELAACAMGKSLSDQN
jgi:hypothetical protein